MANLKKSPERNPAYRNETDRRHKQAMPSATAIAGVERKHMRVVTYIFAVFLSAARLHAKVKPSHRAVFPAGQKCVRVIWYRHNLTKKKGGCSSEEASPELRERFCGKGGLFRYLIRCSIMAGELTLSVVLGTLLSVRVVDDAVAGAGDDLLTVGVGHELCTEDVCPMT